MHVVINGNAREFPDLSSPAVVADLIRALELKGDRIAIEHNGTIVRRPAWDDTPIAEGDRFEVVHFVGGGCAAFSLRRRALGPGTPREPR